LAAGICGAIIFLIVFGRFLWTEYIFPKPKLRVALHFKLAGKGADQQEVVCLHGTNMGPGRILVNTVLFRAARKGFGRPEFSHMRDGRSRGLPKKIEVGEEYIVTLDSGDVHGSERVGFEDSWGRRFWVVKSEMRGTRTGGRSGFQTASATAAADPRSLGLSQKT